MNRRVEKETDMDLLRRYLNAVKFWLPAEQQNDMIAELSEDLRSQAEDRERALGRTLTPAEWETILKERGHPLVVANGYLPQRYLIGPVLFPVYLFVLKLAAFCCLVPSLAIWVGMVILAPKNGSLHPSFWGALWPALFTTIPVTFAFAMAERYQDRWLGLWSPGKLPAVRDTRRISRGTTLWDIVVNGMFAGWAVQALVSPVLLERPEMRIALTMAGRELLSGFLILAAGLVVLGSINLVKPYWTRLRYGLRAASYGASAVLLAFCLRVQPLLDVTGSAVTSDGLRVAGQAFRAVVWGGIGVAALLGALELRKAVRREDREGLVAEAMMVG